jgi:hypothetical protein
LPQHFFWAPSLGRWIEIGWSFDSAAGLVGELPPFCFLPRLMP